MLHGPSAALASLPAQDDFQIPTELNTEKESQAMSQPTSHSELFGLSGQDKPGFPSQVGAKAKPSKEGEGVLGGAGHPTGSAPASGGSTEGAGANVPGRSGEESTVAGIKQGTADGTVPGSGGSLGPSQGTGEVAGEQKSTSQILNPMK